MILPRRGAALLTAAAVLGGLAFIQGSHAPSAAAATASEVASAKLITPAVPVTTQRQQILDTIASRRVGYGLNPLPSTTESTNLAQKIAERSALKAEVTTASFSTEEYVQGGCRNVVATGASWVDYTAGLPGVDGNYGYERLQTYAPGFWEMQAKNTSATEIGVGVALSQYTRQVDNRVVYQINWTVLMGNCTVASQQNADGSVSYGGIRVNGEILKRYQAQGASAGALSAPASAEFGPIRDRGYGQHFRNGSIYWSPSTGAQVITGQIKEEYARMGWENSWLGYPTTGEIAIKGGVLQRFQGGLMYWSPATGAHAVGGAILGLYASYGWENGPLGFPTVTETALRNGGAYSGFQGGNVYWTQRTGAHSVRGFLLSSYGNHGYENGSLGYPTTEQWNLPFDPRTGVKGAWDQSFERGNIEARTLI